MAEQQTRRSFLTWATHGLGVMFAAILGAPAVAYLIDGLNRAGSASKLMPVQDIDLAELRAIPADKLPVVKQGVIRAVRRDAWTLHPNDVIGLVWVIKYGAGNNDIRVFTTICPHLGCSINLQPGNTGFKCPCHGAEFNLDGAKVGGESNPAPRGMDTLVDDKNKNADIKTRGWTEDETHRVMLVEYRNFRQGEATRVPKT